MINWIKEHWIVPVGVIGILFLIICFGIQIVNVQQQALRQSQLETIQKIMTSNLSSEIKDSIVKTLLAEPVDTVKSINRPWRSESVRKLNSLTPPLVVIAVCDTSFTSWDDGAEHQIVIRDFKNRFEVIYDRAMAMTLKVGDTIQKAGK